MNELMSKTTVINPLRGHNQFDFQFELTYSEFKKYFFSQNLLLLKF